MAGCARARAARPCGNGATCELPAALESVREARQFTRSTLQRWDLSGLRDSMELVASELVTNALRYAVPVGTSRRARTAEPGPVDLTGGVCGA